MRKFMKQVRYFYHELYSSYELSLICLSFFSFEVIRQNTQTALE